MPGVQNRATNIGLLLRRCARGVCSQADSRGLQSRGVEAGSAQEKRGGGGGRAAGRHSRHLAAAAV